MRKAFNFYKSYYDVAKELDPKDRANFLWAILQKQFENINTPLSGSAKLAYVSQYHSIKEQIEGYFNKTKDPMFTPTEPPCQPPSVPPCQQEKEKEKEKEKVKENIFTFDEFWDLYDKKIGDKTKLKKKYDSLPLRDLELISLHVPKYKTATPDKKYRKNVQTYLNNNSWHDEVLTSGKENKPKYTPTTQDEKW